MKTIRNYQGDITCIGVLKSVDWFENEKMGIAFLDSDTYIVGTWSDFHDGENSHIEGKQTIAVCKDLDDAVLIFHKHLDKIYFKNK